MPNILPEIETLIIEKLGQYKVWYVGQVILIEPLIHFGPTPDTRITTYCRFIGIFSDRQEAAEVTWEEAKKCLGPSDQLSKEKIDCFLKDPERLVINTLSENRFACIVRVVQWKTEQLRAMYASDGKVFRYR